MLVGRATLYGVAAGGYAGASRAIAIFREEISRVMALIGCASVDQLGPECLHFTDDALRSRDSSGRPELKLLDTGRAVAER